MIAMNASGQIANQSTIEKWIEHDNETRGTFGLTTISSRIFGRQKRRSNHTLASKVYLVQSICAMKLEEGGDAKLT